MKASVMIDLSTIVIAADLCARSRLHTNTIREYADHFRSGVKLPPVTVFASSEGNLLVDGFHRYEAAKLAGRPVIEAIIHKGSRLDALLFAVAQNDEHGIRRSKADKIRCVSLLLAEPQCSAWSIEQIARHCKVDRDLARKVRGLAKPGEERIVVRTRGGKTQRFTMTLSDRSVSGGWPREPQKSQENPWQCAQCVIVMIKDNQEPLEVWQALGKLISEEEALAFVAGLKAAGRSYLLRRIKNSVG